MNAYIRFKSDGVFVVGICRELGRVERILTTTDGGELADRASQRAVDALNACDGIESDSLGVLARGESSMGTLAERCVMSTLLFKANNRLWQNVISDARRWITNNGGKL